MVDGIQYESREKEEVKKGSKKVFRENGIKTGVRGGGFQVNFTKEEIKEGTVNVKKENDELQSTFR